MDASKQMEPDELIEASRAGFVLVVSWLLIVAALVISLADLALGFFGPQRLAALAELLVVGIAGLVLRRRRQLSLAGVVLVAGIFVQLVYSSWINGGVESPNMPAFIVLVALGAWYFGPRMMVALVLASATVFLAHALLEMAGLLPEPPPFPPLRRLVSLIVVLAVCAALMNFVRAVDRRRVLALGMAQARAEAAASVLAKTSAQLQMVANSVPVMLSHWDRDFRCRWANRHYAEYYGMAPEQLVGMSMAELVGEPYFEEMRSNFERVLAGESVTYDGSPTGAHGAQRLFEVRIVPDRGADGTVQGWFGVLHDITDQRRSERIFGSLAIDTARATGHEFFCKVAQHIAQTYDTSCAMVTELKDGGRTAQSLAFWSGGKFAPDIRYELPGTPCDLVARRGEAFFPRHAARLFPNDAALARMGIESYFGVALRATSGEIIGAIVLMDTKPLSKTADLQAVMQVFAQRAASELERQRNEQALRDAEERKRLVLETSLDAVVTLDDAACIVDWNVQAEATFGWPREQALGRRGPDLMLVEEHREAVLRGFAYWAVTGRASMLNRRTELTGLRRDGSRFPLEIAVTPVKTASGMTFTAFMRDITERSRADEVLRESEARLGVMFHESPTPLILVDAATNLSSDVNAAMCELIGYPRERLVGRSFVDLDLYANPAAARAAVEDCRRDGRINQQEFELKRADGRRLVCLAAGRTIEANGVRSRLWSLVDVTAQREAQRQMGEMNETLERSVTMRTGELSAANRELRATLDSLRSAQDQLLRSEKLAALGRLVAGVAHELNTPIGNGLLVATALREQTGAFAHSAAAGLKRSVLEGFLAQSRDAADMLERNLEKAAGLIASFKQVAADQASSQRRLFRLDAVVNEVLVTHRPMLRKTLVSVTQDISRGIVLDSYPGPLGQVLSNLINNAVMHAHDGRAAGSISIEARRDASRGVRLVVRDDGHGIPDEHLGHVFDPFYTTRLGRGGTGLGLHICHNLVTQVLGGTIEIESAPGRGTAVTMLLPLAPGTAQRASAPTVVAVAA